MDIVNHSRQDKIMCLPRLLCTRIDLVRVHRLDRTFHKLLPMADVLYKLWFGPHAINYVTFEHNKPMKNCPIRCELFFRIKFAFDSKFDFIKLQIIMKTHVVGSSKNKTGGLSNNSKAIDKRFRCPPDKLPHRVNFERINCNVFKTLSI